MAKSVSKVVYKSKFSTPSVLMKMFPYVVMTYKYPDGTTVKCRNVSIGDGLNHDNVVNILVYYKNLPAWSGRTNVRTMKSASHTFSKRYANFIPSDDLE